MLQAQQIADIERNLPIENVFAVAEERHPHDFTSARPVTVTPGGLPLVAWQQLMTDAPDHPALCHADPANQGAEIGRFAVH